MCEYCKYIVLARQTVDFTPLLRMAEAAALKASERLSATPRLTACDDVAISFPAEAQTSGLEAWFVGSKSDQVTVAVYAITHLKGSDRLAAHGRFTFAGGALRLSDLPS